MTGAIVATWGTFDGELHPGHLHFLKSCTTHGDVTVFLTNDSQIRENKHREPIYPQEIRKENLLDTGYVSKVIIGTADQGENIEITVDQKPDLYIFGEDHTSKWNMDLEQRLINVGVTILWTKRYKPDLYSTTKIYRDATAPTKVNDSKRRL